MCVVAAMLAASTALFLVPALASASPRRRFSPQNRRSQPQTRRSLSRHLGSGCPGAYDPIGDVPSATIESATVCVLNRERAAYGLPGVRANGRLIRSAQRWTNTMVRDRAFSHGSDFSARITAVGFDWARAGENIADGYRTAAGAVTAWMRSLGHCQNILTPDFREVGAGFDRGSAIAGGVSGTWTLDLAIAMGQRSLSENWAPAEGCPY